MQNPGGCRGRSALSSKNAPHIAGAADVLWCLDSVAIGKHNFQVCSQYAHVAGVQQ